MLVCRIRSFFFFFFAACGTSSSQSASLAHRKMATGFGRQSTNPQRQQGNKYDARMSEDIKVRMEVSMESHLGTRTISYHADDDRACELYYADSGQNALLIERIERHSRSEAHVLDRKKRHQAKQHSIAWHSLLLPWK